MNHIFKFNVKLVIKKRDSLGGGKQSNQNQYHINKCYLVKCFGFFLRPSLGIRCIIQRRKNNMKYLQWFIPFLHRFVVPFGIII